MSAKSYQVTGAFHPAMGFVSGYGWSPTAQPSMNEGTFGELKTHATCLSRSKRRGTPRLKKDVHQDHVVQQCPVDLHVVWLKSGKGTGLPLWLILHSHVACWVHWAVQVAISMTCTIFLEKRRFKKFEMHGYAIFPDQSLLSLVARVRLARSEREALYAPCTFLVTPRRACSTEGARCSSLGSRSTLSWTAWSPYGCPHISVHPLHPRLLALRSFCLKWT